MCIRDSPKADKDKAAAPKPEAPAQKPENEVKKEPEKKTAPTVQAAPAPKEPEKPKDAPRRGKEQIVYIKLNELHAFKNHPFEVRDDEEMRAMVSSVKDLSLIHILNQLDIRECMRWSRMIRGIALIQGRQIYRA